VDSPRVTSTFRSLITIGLIVAIVTSLAIVPSAPLDVVLFGTAVLLVLLDLAVPGGRVTGRQRRFHLPTLRPCRPARR